MVDGKAGCERLRFSVEGGSVRTGDETRSALMRFLWQDVWPPQEMWPGLLQVAARHKVLPIVALLVRQREDGLPPEIRSSLRETRLHLLARQIKVEWQVEQLMNTAARLEIKAMLLKGPVIARTYPHPAARTFGDLDVLVASEDSARQLAHVLTCEEGYEQRAGCRAWGQVPGLYPRKAGLYVEVHHHLGEGAWALPMEEIWERARRAADGTGLWEMDVVDHALYMMMHAVGQHTLCVGVRWLYDLSCWTREWTDETWTALVARAEAWGLTPVVRLTSALWAWVQELPWESLPLARVVEPPPAEIAAVAQHVMLDGMAVGLPAVWRDSVGKDARGWLRYGWAVLSRGGEIGLPGVPKRAVYLVRQHGPSLWKLLRGDAQTESVWEQQRALYTWLGSGR
jgi:hypothetical protein